MRTKTSNSLAVEPFFVHSLVQKYLLSVFYVPEAAISIGTESIGKERHIKEIWTCDVVEVNMTDP
jgi:hypothetical protein